MWMWKIRSSIAACATLLVLIGITPGQANAQGIDHVKAHYTKYEYRIPMRDGVRLLTAVYVPKEQNTRYPILLMRTPYGVGPYGVDAYKADLGPSPAFGREGYIFAYQDVRGRWMSEGTFENMRPHRDRKEKPSDIDESTDTYDTIDWLIKNLKNHNGRVGMWGISYPGFYTAAGMIDAHPTLKAASPQAPVTDWFAGDDWHHNGAFFLPHAFNFLFAFDRPHPEPAPQKYDRFKYGTPDGYDFYLQLGPLANANRRYFKNELAFWNEILRHGRYDEFWKARDIRQHLKNIKPAVMTVGGWFDAENLFGALETYKKVEASSPRTTNVLVMGPWRHGGWSRSDGASLGPIAFDSRTSEFFRDQIQFPFFQYHLKGVGKSEFPEAWVFETGTNRWRTFEAWPPHEARPRSFYLGEHGTLGIDPPKTASDGQNSEAFDEYVSDPAHPVGYIDQIAIGMTGDYMVQDQRFASRRPDVLVYTGEVLKEDVTIVGPIRAKLFVSTSGTDSDWIVKLIDVYPGDHPDGPNSSVKLGGYQQLVRGDVLRGKFRNSLSKPNPFVPDQPTPLAFTLQDIDHTFRAGHRVMVQIQSSWFPLVDRNPQTFTDIYHARESDFHKATQRVYRTSRMPSHLECLELPH